MSMSRDEELLAQHIREATPGTLAVVLTGELHSLLRAERERWTAEMAQQQCDHRKAVAAAREEGRREMTDALEAKQHTCDLLERQWRDAVGVANRNAQEALDLQRKVDEWKAAASEATVARARAEGERDRFAWVSHAKGFRLAQETAESIVTAHAVVSGGCGQGHPRHAGRARGGGPASKLHRLPHADRRHLRPYVRRGVAMTGPDILKSPVRAVVSDV